jgi:hypothetical protein
MKNILYSFLTVFLIINLCIMPRMGTAQNPFPIDCAYEDDCVIIGYESVTPIPNTNNLEIVMSYQVACTIVASIAITPVQSTNILINRGEFALNQINHLTFQVNRNTFYSNNPNQDSRLRIRINYDGRPNVLTDIKFTNEEDCQAINPLPVELTSFKGKVTESGINLEWETASEINNSHFDVERSSNGKTYEAIAIVKGRGTTSVASNYSFTDKLPQKGLNYYRLKQVDFDNTTSYSNTIAVTWDASETIEIALVPNPCLNGDCNIAISNAANLETLVQLKDMTGRVVYSKTIRSDRHLLELPMANLKQYKGLFFLTAATGKQVVHQRILLE